MHHHLEIVMPTNQAIRNSIEHKEVATIHEAVSQILREYDESYENGDGDSNDSAFWDWWVIGGRFSGRKLLSTLDKTQIALFWEEIKTMNLTVSGIVAGKDEISPKEQIPLVDNCWWKYFPEQEGNACPFFKHSNNQYDDSSLIIHDIMPFDQVPSDLEMTRFMVANYQDVFNQPSILTCRFMLVDSLWNGEDWQDTIWNKTFGQAMEEYMKKIEQYKEEYKEKMVPDSSWICVTVDYHN